MWYVFANRIKTAGSRGADSAMWEAFFQDMDFLAQGVDPDLNPLYVDDNGNQWGGCLLFGQADLEQICIHYGLKSYNDNDEMCPWCDANRTDRKYTNLQADSEWRPSENMTNDVFRGNSLAVDDTS